MRLAMYGELQVSSARARGALSRAASAAAAAMQQAKTRIRFVTLFSSLSGICDERRRLAPRLTKARIRRQAAAQASQCFEGRLDVSFEGSVGADRHPQGHPAADAGRHEQGQPAARDA